MEETKHEKTRVRTRRSTKFLVFISFVFVFFSVCGAANAATLYFSPSSGSHAIGATFSVSVYVSSVDHAMNAASGIISFPSDKLEVTSLSKTGSIFTLWVQEPSFSNSAGTVNFESIVLNPGFTGSSGKAITITFRAKAAGNAPLTFSSGSVLANDGQGTNILTSLGNAQFVLEGAAPTAPTVPETTTPSAVSVAPSAPQVLSSSHPDSNKWYNNKNPQFSWILPTGVNGVSVYLSKSRTANPGPFPDGLFSSKSYQDIEDGIWYFHIKMRNAAGWGPITHRKVLIDTTPPLPFEIEVQREDPTDPQPVLLFETVDELSGVEYYEVKIGEGEPFPVERIKIQSYKLPSRALGKHSIEVRAFDKAGNYTSTQTEIEVLPIETPVITTFPKGVGEGQSLTLEGKSLPGATIRVFWQTKGKKPVMEEVRADEEGKWSFISSPLEKGDYEAWIEAKDIRGALSLPSQKISFEVGLPPLLKFGTIAISYLIIVSTLIVLIVVALGVIFYTWYRISLWRKRISKETKEAAQIVARAFRALREEVQEQIEYLDKKPGLTKGEKEIRDKLQEALNISEEFIGKEIDDIEKEIKK